MTCADCLVPALRAHVRARGVPTVPNGAWQMMLDAADLIEDLQRQLAQRDQAVSQAHAAIDRSNTRAGRYQAVVVGLRSQLTHNLAQIDGLLLDDREEKTETQSTAEPDSAGRAADSPSDNPGQDVSPPATHQRPG